MRNKLARQEIFEDIEFFDQNPRRYYRLRGPLPHENWRGQHAVYRVEHDVTVALPVPMFTLTPNGRPFTLDLRDDSEETAQMIFNELTRWIPSYAQHPLVKIAKRAIAKREVRYGR